MTSMGSPEIPVNSVGGNGDGLEEEVEEIEVDITEENLVWLHGTDWELVLSPLEARQLGQALLDAATDAESAE